MIVPLIGVEKYMYVAAMCMSGNVLDKTTFSSYIHALPSKDI